jgi:hypothetical protein
MSEMTCKRCGADENRIDGFCSIECRDKFYYEEDIRELESRITELEGAQRWIPVSERLPEPKTCVLVYDAGGNMTVDFLVTSGDVEKYFWLAKYRIMFWMPLPTPPAVQE